MFNARRYKAAVTTDGTIMLALNVSQMRDAMQFAFAFRDLSLAFNHDQVSIFNADGVDLTLFTLNVDTTQHQWGDYYGWTVEGDSGIPSEIYEGLSEDSDDLTRTSDLFTYWRHEFHTYAAAHAPGGTHEVGANGYHPDMTLHIDHDYLIIAIQGVERDAMNPGDLSLARPLEPGMREVELGWISLRSDDPIDLWFVAPLISDADEDWAEELEEMLFDGDDGYDSDDDDD